MKKEYLLTTLPIVFLGIFILLLFCQIGPGGDFFVAYHLMVFEPEKYSNTYGIFSPAWLSPIMAPFETMPERKGYYVFLAVTILSVILAIKTFGGKYLPVLLSAQIFWILWWGQIDGLSILGVVLGWLALEKRSLFLLVAGLVLATVKPQIGLIPILAIWWWSEPKLRWKALGIMAVIAGASIYIWGWWPVWIIKNITGLVDNNRYGTWNISLGLIALPLLIPAVLLPLNRPQRLIALTATLMLISPYMPYYSSILLLCMAIPWWTYVFAFIGFLPNLIGTQLAWRSITFLPILVLIWLYFPFMKTSYSDIRRRLAGKK